ncbi:hypothetical protein GCM10007927_09480 [Sulfitobacter pacificus]|uniref:Uncharacterized protein n=1 Tax=Sulfitobacter pacificus TaxID=1499314 RepID=A0ABQ5VGD3_9RHOB|nr:hypothetical protein GCM10007927_09480 [Sulfitobacter pacificus]
MGAIDMFWPFNRSARIQKQARLEAAEKNHEKQIVKFDDVHQRLEDALRQFHPVSKDQVSE